MSGRSILAGNLAVVAAAAAGLSAGRHGVATVLVGLAGVVLLPWSAFLAHFRPIVLLAALHGALVGQAQALAEVPAPRGPGPFVHEVEVLGIAEGGPGCRIRGRIGSTGPWLVDLPSEVCPVARGQTVRIVGAERLRGRLAPGGPEVAPVAWAAGAVGWLRAPYAFAAGRPAPWTAVPTTVRWRVIELASSSPAHALVAAAVFGQRGMLDRTSRERLRTAGLGHLVAVSGLHVGLVAAFCVALGLRATAGRSVSAALVFAVVPVLVFVAVTGAAPPAVRAATTLGAVHLCLRRGMVASGIGLVSAVAAAMALVRPYWTLSASYQLSVAAALALATAPARLGMVATTWRLTWALAPLCAFHFGDVPFSGLWTNLVAVPVFAGWVLPLGCLGGLVAPWSRAIFDAAAWGGAWILDVAAVSAGVPTPDATACAWVGVGLYLAGRFRCLARARPPVAAVVGLVAVAVAQRWTLADPPPAWIAHGRRAVQSVVWTPEGPCVRGEGPLADALADAVTSWTDPAGLSACRSPAAGSPDDPHLDAAAAAIRRCGRGVRFARGRGGREECFVAGAWHPLAARPAEDTRGML
ncbi:MAG: ComEC/Rec2 family competence protein [Deltaproteobacteria bacterium]|nr:MAG: ComEC/Rec2 family competence protein [Deltaproteobacteria bacterium]